MDNVKRNYDAVKTEYQAKINSLPNKYSALNTFANECQKEQENLNLEILNEFRIQQIENRDNIESNIKSLKKEYDKLSVFNFFKKRNMENRINKLEQKQEITNRNILFLRNIILNSSSNAIIYDCIYKICNKNMEVEYDESLRSYLNSKIDKEMSFKEYEDINNILSSSQIKIFKKDEKSLDNISQEINDLKISYENRIKTLEEEKIFSSYENENPDLLNGLTENSINDKSNIFEEEYEEEEGCEL